MKTISQILILLCFKLTLSQTVEIFGQVTSKDDVENIHVINKTLKKYTTTNAKGEFLIAARANDTLVFSSVQHKLLTIKINPETIESKYLEVTLTEYVNQLDEVVVGKILTGDLLSDVKNVEGKPPINFYDVGIPGYKGKPKTQTERELFQAGEFKPNMLIGLVLGGAMPLNPVINGITGRTKMLKKRVALEREVALIENIKREFGVMFLNDYPIPTEWQNDFWYFCQDDENFENRCKNKNGFEILEYLQEKRQDYLKNKKEN